MTADPRDPRGSDREFPEDPTSRSRPVPPRSDESGPTSSSFAHLRPSASGPHGSARDDDEAEDPLARLREAAQEHGEKRDAARSFWRELPLLIVVALVVAVLIKTFLVQAFFIPSASMRDTLIEGDRVMVNKLAYRFGAPDRGDVIVFDSPLEPGNDGENILSATIRHVAESLGLSSPDSALIKRVIAVGGETLEIRDSTVFIDGVPLEEPYLKDGSFMRDFGPVTVPDGHVFVMGDNRNQSQDSRRFGTIPESEIIGRAFVIVWPPGRWSGL